MNGIAMDAGTVHISRLPRAFEDSRGIILDLLITDDVARYVGTVTFHEGAVRGNHYHKLSTQFDYVLSGNLELLTGPVNGRKPARRDILSAGHLVRIPPNIVHAFRAIEPAVIINITTHSRDAGRYESDTYRVAWLRELDT
jgi:quercetin dioxygenase-like cupin family protein